MTELVKEPTQSWGGDWTKKKIEILVEYAKAYLTIMNKYPFWKLLYFDGFAGTGIISGKKETDVDITIGAARRIVEINEPREFDQYYFVEKNKTNAAKLEANTKSLYPNKNIIIAVEDCNKKLLSLSQFLKSPKGKKTKVLAYLDPYGMQLEWSSIESLADAGIDLWILVPTGMGVNRLLKTNGDISEEWITKLKVFLGMDEIQIREYFYKEKIELTLFGEEKRINKETNAIEKSGVLYRERLNMVFKFVSDPFILRSSQGNILYHMFLASNNHTARKIANDVIKKYNQLA
jgi:three-Cys-motif partner protein